ncbi:unnamed protein product [Sphagnum compactum]
MKVLRSSSKTSMLHYQEGFAGEDMSRAPPPGVSGYLKCKQVQKCTETVLKMQSPGVKPDFVTFVAVLNAGASVQAAFSITTVMLEHFLILVRWHNISFLFATVMYKEFCDSDDLL